MVCERKRKMIIENDENVYYFFDKKLLSTKSPLGTVSSGHYVTIVHKTFTDPDLMEIIAEQGKRILNKKL